MFDLYRARHYPPPTFLTKETKEANKSLRGEGKIAQLSKSQVRNRETPQPFKVQVTATLVCPFFCLEINCVALGL